MKRNGFTLIELLVVVAIIGILAAVGVVAYNGYTGAAKVNATKAILKGTIKYTQTELMKCELGESKVMNGYLNCSDLNPKWGAFRTMVALNQGAYNINQNLVLPYINPYDNSRKAVRSASNFEPGQVSISQKGTNLQFFTCYKIGCSSKDVTRDYIDISNFY